MEETLKSTHSIIFNLFLASPFSPKKVYPELENIKDSLKNKRRREGEEDGKVSSFPWNTQSSVGKSQINFNSIHLPIRYRKVK